MHNTCLARHDLVWLKHAAITSARPHDNRDNGGNCCSGGITVDERRKMLANWIDADRPLVTARQSADVPPGHVRLGLPLPPSSGKLRLAFDIPVGEIHVSTPPPLLREIADRLPAKWQAQISRILSNPAIAATQPRVFGSAAMQALTGLSHVTASSDIDLVLATADWPATTAVIAALRELDASTTIPSIDGEIVDPRGHAASWRELSSGAKRIIMKSMHDVSLVTLQTYIDGFARPVARAFVT